MLIGACAVSVRYFARSLLERMTGFDELQTIIADPKWMQMKIAGRSQLYSNRDFSF
jgi:hypothetical protein